jgi:DNA-directed RNA polymerase II subunit RPB2
MELFKKYIEDHPYFLSQHNLESFDTFINDGIRKAILENEHPLRILKKKNKASSEFTHRINLYFGGKSGIEYKYELPKLTPNICRLEGKDYMGKLTVKVDVEIFEHDEVTYETFEVNLVDIPTMVHSTSCILRGKSKEELYNFGDCPYEQGGYFIIGGLEKVIVAQERHMSNAIVITETDDPNIPLKTYVRSQEEGRAQTPQATYMRLDNEGKIMVLVPFIKLEVNVCILFRALGVETDREIAEMICGDLNTEAGKLMSSLLLPSIEFGNKYPIQTQESALRFLATLTKIQPEKGDVKWKQNIIYILSKRLFPHSNGDNSIHSKSAYLAHMTRQLLLTKSGYIKPTDKDSLRQRQFIGCGELLTEIFRDFYREYINLVRSRLFNRFEYKKEYQNNFSRILTKKNSSEIFQSMDFQQMINKSFRGKWGLKPNSDESLGIVQDLQRLSYLGSVSHIRRTHLYLPDSAKLVDPRRLHGSQWGYICPIETPDGGNVSQLKHIAIMVKYSPQVDSRPLTRIFRLIGMIQRSFDETSHRLFVNGNWIGSLNEPDIFVDMFLLLRRTKLVHYSISIAWKISLREVHISTQSGRLLRPLGIAGSSKAPFETPCNTLLGGDSWDKMVQGYKNGTYDEGFFTKFFSKESSRDSLFEIIRRRDIALIEYVDPIETDTLLINLGQEYTQLSQFTHYELDPSYILGTTALTLPFLEHNPSPRNLFAVGQGKQAVSVYVSNFRNRLDQTASLLYYGQKPLVHGGYLDIMNENKFPYGINAVVAIGTFTGYNQEDSIILNRTSVERGMFISRYTKTHSLYEEHSFGSILKICNPLLENIRLKPGYDYSHLDEQGIIKAGTHISSNTILIGGAIKDEKGEWVDASLTYIMAHDHEVVQKVYISPLRKTSGARSGATSGRGIEGYELRVAKVMTCEIREPIIGDKFAARSAQKGTVGLLVDSWNMPYTKDGIIPDIVINPHAFPSRMTMGYFLEILSGLLGVESGALIQATAFHGLGKSPETITDILLRALDKVGIRNQGEFEMYNGTTGEMTCTKVCMGPIYYQRLKQMVTDKMYARGSGGPKDMMTQQPLHGRARGGGLRNGEMERDVLLSHGISQFAKETYFERADGYKTFMDTDTGNIVPPNHMGAKCVKFPYAFKLLQQEATTMGVKMKLEIQDN